MTPEARAAVVAAGYISGAVAGGILWWAVRGSVKACLKSWFTPREKLVEGERTRLTAGDEEAGSAPAAAGSDEAARLSAELQALLAQADVLREEQAKAQARSDAAGIAEGEEAALTAEDLATMAAQQQDSLWDRGEFLQQCASAVNALSKVLDDALCDAFDGPALGPRLARALHALFRAAEEEVGVDVTARRAALLAAAAPTPDRAKRDAVEASPAFQALVRGVLAALQQDAALWQARAGKLVDTWLAGLPSGAQPACDASGVAALQSGGGRCELVALAALHMRLALWPVAAEANIEWTAEAAPQPPQLALDNDAHQLFSVDGKPLAAGAPVFAAGPSLRGRTPHAGSGPAAVGPATAAQLAELRGRRCRTVVVSAQGS